MSFSVAPRSKSATNYSGRPGMMVCPRLMLISPTRFHIVLRGGSPAMLAMEEAAYRVYRIREAAARLHEARNSLDRILDPVREVIAPGQLMARSELRFGPSWAASCEPVQKTLWSTDRQRVATRFVLCRMSWETNSTEPRVAASGSLEPAWRCAYAFGHPLGQPARRRPLAAAFRIRGPGQARPRKRRALVHKHRRDRGVLPGDAAPCGKARAVSSGWRELRCCPHKRGRSGV